jgi:NitT/TauT family transport system substrate-binding protein
MAGCEATVIRRRRLLQLAGAAFAQAAVWPARAAEALRVRVATNGGLENQTLIALIERQEFLRSVGVSQALVLVGSPAETFEALVDNRADICVVSGFNGVLPAIENGAPVKVVGAALRAPALAVYSARPDVRSVSDLVGRTVGIGPDFALLHVLMLTLLKAKEVDPGAVRFIHIGSNAEVYQAVKAGKVDAGPSDVSNVPNAEASGLRVLSDGKMWSELARYPYQLAYASDRAIRENRDGLVRTLAAYGKLFRFMSAADAWPAYLEARTAAGAGAGATAGAGAEAGVRAAWDYIQSTKPYAGSPETTKERLDYLQSLHVALGLQKAVLPIESIADLSLARDATRMI